MKVSVAGKPDEYFAHVVSFAELGLIDTRRVPMTYKQCQTIRTLRYGPAVKVYIKFKTSINKEALALRTGLAESSCILPMGARPTHVS